MAGRGNSVRRIGYSLILIFALWACAEPIEQPSTPGRAVGGGSALAIEPGPYVGVAWMDDDSLVLARERREGPVHSELWHVRSDGSSGQVILGEADPSCRVTSYAQPSRLPDGRLGFVKYCTPYASPDTSTFDLMAYDLKTSTVQGLAEVPFSVARYSWSPTLRQALVARSSDICAGIAKVDRDGVSYLDVEISDGTSAFSLDEEFRVDQPQDSCASTGLADWPAWSPRGRDRVAFFGSTEAIGQAGFERLEAPWSLYVMNTRTWTPTDVVDGVNLPRGLAWSHDGTMLAFGGEVNGKAGLWVHPMGSDGPELVAAEVPEWWSWSPDGERIVGVLDPDLGRWPPRAKAYVYELEPELTEGS